MLSFSLGLLIGGGLGLFLAAMIIGGQHGK